MLDHVDTTRNQGYASMKEQISQQSLNLIEDKSVQKITVGQGKIVY